MANWIAKATSKHKGLFSRKAKSAGMSTSAFARKVLSPDSEASTKTKREAALAQTLGKLRPKRKSPFSNKV